MSQVEQAYWQLSVGLCIAHEMCMLDPLRLHSIEHTVHTVAYAMYLLHPLPAGSLILMAIAAPSGD